MTWVLLLTGSYLLGSVSFSYWIVRLLQGRDVRTVGSGNAGATNVLRAAGKLPAALVLVLDIGKGIVPVLVARELGAPAAVVGGAGFAAVLGHVYPIFLGWRGGKGVATAAGALGLLYPAASVGSLVIFLVVLALWRFVSLGSMAAAVALPLLAWALPLLGLDRAVPALQLATAAASAALVLIKHIPNLRRLIAGTELHFGERRPKERQ